MRNFTGKIFLGKLGKVFGPYEAAEIESMQASGKIMDFTWIWDGALGEWKTLETPPPSPIVEVSASESGRKRSTSSTSGGSDRPDWSEVEALCHDSSHVVSGLLTQVTETGCELVTADHSASPVFGLKTVAVLNLMNAATGTSTNIPVRMLNVARVNGAWVYRVSWNQVPSLRMPEQRSA